MTWFLSRDLTNMFKMFNVDQNGLDLEGLVKIKPFELPIF